MLPSLRPITNTKCAATTGISKHLDNIIDGVGLLDELQRYIQEGYFTASMLIVTIDMTDL